MINLHYAFLLRFRTFPVNCSWLFLWKSTSAWRAVTDLFSKFPSAHAEVLVIREACQVLGNERLIGCDLYVTLEPCAMCAALISASRIRRLYYGASDIKSGGVEQGARIFSHSQTHHRPEIYPGICEEEVIGLMSSFFGDLRH